MAFYNAPVHAEKLVTDPGTNTILQTDVKGRTIVEIYCESIAAATILIQSSADQVIWLDVEEQTTTLLNAKYIFHKSYFNAARHVRVTIEETGSGDHVIHIDASAY